MLAPPTRRIEVREEGGLFVVEIIPPTTEGASFDATYPTHRSARSYAKGVRLVTGWQLVDLCEEHDGAR